MANIALVTLSKDWAKLEDLIAEEVSGFAFDTANTYFLQYRGNSSAITFEGDNLPNSDDVDGVLWNNKDFGEYKPDSSYDLYVKASMGGAFNVTMVEGE